VNNFELNKRDIYSLLFTHFGVETIFSRCIRFTCSTPCWTWRN